MTSPRCLGAAAVICVLTLPLGGCLVGTAVGVAGDVAEGAVNVTGDVAEGAVDVTGAAARAVIPGDGDETGEEEARDD